MFEKDSSSFPSTAYLLPQTLSCLFALLLLTHLSLRAYRDASFAGILSGPHKPRAQSIPFKRQSSLLCGGQRGQAIAVTCDATHVLHEALHTMLRPSIATAILTDST